MTSQNIQSIREAAEADLVTFVKLVAPKTILGHCHEDLLRWWTREDAKNFQLVLFPRDHQKSRMVAYRVAHYLTKYPDARILYISSTSNLAEKQLKFIKDILTSDIYRRYWPEHVNPDVSKREKWTNSEISLDHPLRAEEGIRDPSVFTAGLTTSITGMHCDVAVMDDVVVYENAYTKEGRDKVKSQYSLLTSIESADAEEWIVGTRYHPKDLYSDLLKAVEDIYDEDGNKVDEEPIYECMEKAVEDNGDGTGDFLWPRQRRSDGKWFGFDRKILAQKRGKYLDKTQFRAQYYNDPNDPDEAPIDMSKFQYYDRKQLSVRSGIWYLGNERLNIFASIDFAYTISKKADYTCLAVVGIDRNSNYYVLDLERIKTDKISEYYALILKMQNKWAFRKLRAEVTAAQSIIVKDLKANYIQPSGIALSIDEHKPTRHSGSKEERIAAILEPRYDNLQMWHYRGGECQTLEEELVLANPPHDDCKDALSSCVEICVAPAGGMVGHRRTSNVVSHPRFGGVA